MAGQNYPISRSSSIDRAQLVQHEQLSPTTMTPPDAAARGFRPRHSSQPSKASHSSHSSPPSRPSGPSTATSSGARPFLPNTPDTVFPCAQRRVARAVLVAATAYGLLLWWVFARVAWGDAGVESWLLSAALLGGPLSGVVALAALAPLSHVEVPAAGGARFVRGASAACLGVALVGALANAANVAALRYLVAAQLCLLGILMPTLYGALYTAGDYWRQGLVRWLPDAVVVFLTETTMYEFMLDSTFTTMMGDMWAQVWPLFCGLSEEEQEVTLNRMDPWLRDVMVGRGMLRLFPTPVQAWLAPADPMVNRGLSFLPALAEVVGPLFQPPPTDEGDEGGNGGSQGSSGMSPSLSSSPQRNRPRRPLLLDDPVRGRAPSGGGGGGVGGVGSVGGEGGSETSSQRRLGDDDDVGSPPPSPVDVSKDESSDGSDRSLGGGENDFKNDPESIDSRFARACALTSASSSSSSSAAAAGAPTLSNATKLRIYALFKQANEGRCKTPKPGMFEVVKKAKWNAWSALGGMQQDEAKGKYAAEIFAMYAAHHGAEPAAGADDRREGGGGVDGGSSGGDDDAGGVAQKGKGRGKGSSSLRRPRPQKLFGNTGESRSSASASSPSLSLSPPRHPASSSGGTTGTTVTTAPTVSSASTGTTGTTTLSDVRSAIRALSALNAPVPGATPRPSLLSILIMRRIRQTAWDVHRSTSPLARRGAIFGVAAAWVVFFLFRLRRLRRAAAGAGWAQRMVLSRLYARFQGLISVAALVATVPACLEVGRMLLKAEATEEQGGRGRRSRGVVNVVEVGEEDADRETKE